MYNVLLEHKAIQKQIQIKTMQKILIIKRMESLFCVSDFYQKNIFFNVIHDFGGDD